MTIQNKERAVRAARETGRCWAQDPAIRNTLVAAFVESWRSSHAMEQKSFCATAAAFLGEAFSQAGPAEQAELQKLFVEGMAAGTGAQSISRHGITWHFSEERPSGTYVNGDPWVQGPVTIVSIEPSSVVGRNGSMLNPNPSNGQRQGYDSKMHWREKTPGSGNWYSPTWDPALNVGDRLPLMLNEDSLVSTKSVAAAGSRPQIQTAAVLTVVRDVPPDGAFRPSYAGEDKTSRWTRADVHEELLELTEPPTAPLEPLILPRSTSGPSWPLARAFERVWLDQMAPTAGVQQQIVPLENGPGYGAQTSELTGMAFLRLLSRPRSKDHDRLLVGVLQRGIDAYGTAQSVSGAAGAWKGAGGFGQGRLLPILGAGLLLGDLEMLEFRQRHPEHHFGEIDQTFQVAAEHGYPPLMVELEFPEWRVRVGQETPRWLGSEGGTGGSYRTCCTASWWWATVAALQLLGLRGFVDHEPLFEYQRRYLDAQVRGIQQPTEVGAIAGKNRLTIGHAWARTVFEEVLG